MAASDFLWGAATSSHQVEGDNRYNDWWAWEEAGKLKEPSKQACNHYELFDRDFDLAAQLGHTAHRFSLEWSRLEPGKNVWDEEGFRHYEEVLKALHERGIEPIVTLHHFTNPQWLSEMGGWHHPESIHHFRKYTKKVVESLGKYVKYWVTINEPLVLLHFGYMEGTWPPGFKDMEKALAALRNMLHAHVASYQAIHTHYEKHLEITPLVSVAKHMSYLVPHRETSYADSLSVFFRNCFFNHLFIQAAHTGFLFFPGVFCEPLARHSTLDYIALNYYTRHLIRFGGLSVPGLLGEMRDDGKNLDQNMLGWEICPEGLYELLKQLHRYRLPIFVTENGICTEDDDQRKKFIEKHLAVVKQARQEGIPVNGYLHWSLLDNFEWAEGFGPRFGLVDINYQNLERKVRPSAQVLSEWCRNI